MIAICGCLRKKKCACIFTPWPLKKGSRMWSLDSADFLDRIWRNPEQGKRPGAEVLHLCFQSRKKVKQALRISSLVFTDHIMSSWYPATRLPYLCLHSKSLNFPANGHGWVENILTQHIKQIHEGLYQTIMLYFFAEVVLIYCNFQDTDRCCLSLGFR